MPELHFAHTRFVRPIGTVAVVVIDPVEGDGAGTVEAGEGFALLVELPLCQSRKDDTCCYCYYHHFWKLSKGGYCIFCTIRKLKITNHNGEYGTLSQISQ